MPRKIRRVVREQRAETVRFPAARVQRADLFGTPAEIAPYIGNEMRKVGATQDDINDFYTEVRRCPSLETAIVIAKKYVVVVGTPEVQRQNGGKRKR